jgi:hypothetical protein
VNNNTKKRCHCATIAKLSREAIERLDFELGRVAIKSLKIEGECGECRGVYWVTLTVGPVPKKIFCEK